MLVDQTQTTLEAQSQLVAEQCVFAPLNDGSGVNLFLYSHLQGGWVVGGFWPNGELDLHKVGPVHLPLTEGYRALRVLLAQTASPAKLLATDDVSGAGLTQAQELKLAELWDAQYTFDDPAWAPRPHRIVHSAVCSRAIYEVFAGPNPLRSADGWPGSTPCADVQADAAAMLETLTALAYGDRWSIKLSETPTVSLLTLAYLLADVGRGLQDAHQDALALFLEGDAPAFCAQLSPYAMAYLTCSVERARHRLPHAAPRVTVADMVEHLMRPLAADLNEALRARQP